MSEHTAISWCDSTFNPWIGCTKVSPACDHCYAERLMDHRMHRAQWGAGKPRVRTSAGNWRQPLKWNAKRFMQCEDCGWRGEAETPIVGCGACGSIELSDARRRVFCASLADVFDNEVPNQWRADLFALIDRTPNLDWLLLTKRVGNVLPMLLEIGRERLPVNVWQGISAVNQAEARRDLPKLARLDATVRWLSYEPALGELDLFERALASHGPAQLIEGLDWVIAGGESGPKARPIRREWVDLLREQCDQLGVAFFFKQWGGINATAGGCELDGAEVKAWPTA